MRPTTDDPIDVLGKELADRETELAKAADERLEHEVELACEGIVRRIADISDSLRRVRDKQMKSPQKKMAALLVDEITRAADGNLSVPAYSPREKAEQQVDLFTGCCWQQLGTQAYFDLMNLCCCKAGLMGEDLHDPQFMENVYQQEAFRIAHERPMATPAGESWVNLQNGTLVLRQSGEMYLREHNREDNLHYVLPYAYDPAAQCPRWLAFLDRMLPEPEAQAMLAEYLGYCFTHGLKAEKMLVLVGGGSNGKSVVLEVAERLFGVGNVSNVTLSGLTTEDIKCAMLEGKLVNISYENSKELDANVLKRVVSGEPVTVRRLYKNPYDMRVYAKLIAAYNILPRAEVTHGYYRRFIILPFGVTISEEEQDIDLPKKLAEELPGILNWVLEGLKRYLSTRAFTKSVVSSNALAMYKRQSDSVLLFVDECCEQKDVAGDEGKGLYEQYKRYCEGDGLKPIGKQKFFDRLENLGYKRIERQRTSYFNLECRTS